MSVWNNRAFTENELSKPAKLLVALLVMALVVVEGAAATRNAVHGVVLRPWCSLVIALGFLMFMFPKLYVVRHKRRVSFGVGLMSEGQANSYRVGYFLMAIGYWLTFR